MEQVTGWTLKNPFFLLKFSSNPSAGRCEEQRGGESLCPLPCSHQDKGCQRNPSRCFSAADGGKPPVGRWWCDPPVWHFLELCPLLLTVLEELRLLSGFTSFHSGCRGLSGSFSPRSPALLHPKPQGSGPSCQLPPAPPQLHLHGWTLLGSRGPRCLGRERSLRFRGGRKHVGARGIRTSCRKRPRAGAANLGSSGRSISGIKRPKLPPQTRWRQEEEEENRSVVGFCLAFILKHRRSLSGGRNLLVAS